MIVAGVMSGTSADGIDVAVLRILGRGFRTRFELLAHESYPYAAPVRRMVLAMMNGNAVRVADLARLNFLLGELYAEAVNATAQKHSLKLDLVGCHGQTLYHQADAQPFLRHRVACTWQTGEGAVLARRCGVPAVTDFRPADMAAGGTGAPLVPFLDYILFRHRRHGRVVQNIGGIANLTAIPAAAAPEHVVAFDTGPGNMVIDQVMSLLFGKNFDDGGQVAARGTPLDTVVSEVLRHRFFRRKPPKTAGREEFGREFVEWFLQRCGRARKQDIVATATALTARSIGEAVRLALAVVPQVPETTAPPAAKQTQPPRWDYFLSGGGTKNATLVAMIGRELERFHMKVRTTDEAGLKSEAKEAAAFAVLAYQTWRREPSNIASATGAQHPAILGKISYA